MLKQTKLIAQGAVMAGLLMATPCLAFAADASNQTGTGQSNLVMTVENPSEYGGTEDPSNPPIDSSDPDSPGSNLSFTVPSVMNYVVKADGSLIGPSGDVAHVTNLSAFATHVSSLDVDSEPLFNIVRDATVSTVDNSVDFTVGPNGDALQAVDYLVKKGVNDPTKWNMTAAQSQSQSDELPVQSSGHVSHLTLGTSASSSTVDIPSQIQATGELDGETLSVGYQSGWLGDVVAVDGLVGNQGPIHTLHQFYDANNGYRDPSGFERIGNRYVVSIMEGPFTSAISDDIKVGDHITIVFDDGTSIEAIVGNVASRGIANPYGSDTLNEVHSMTSGIGATDLTCGWGYVDSASKNVRCLEFFGIGASDPMSSAIQTSTGGTMTRVTKITNHGVYADYAAHANIDNEFVESTALTTKFGELHWYLTPGAAV